MSDQGLFRGKRKDNHEWVYGFYVSSPSLPFNDGKSFIIEFIGIESNEPLFDWHEVVAETVGIYMGVSLNGILIFEGDILSCSRTITGIPTANGKAVEVFASNIDHLESRTWEEIMVAEYKTTNLSVSFVIPEEGGTYQERGKKLNWVKIGNKHDNPELLNG